MFESNPSHSYYRFNSKAARYHYNPKIREIRNQQYNNIIPIFLFNKSQISTCKNIYIYK